MGPASEDCLQGWFWPPNRFWRERAGPGLHHAILEHPGAPHPPFTFYMQFCMGGATPGATPEKRVLAASGDMDNLHRLPTHAAGGPQVSPGASLPGGVAIRGAYPRRRRAPCLGGSCRRVATLPYKPVCGVRLMKLCARRRVWINRTPQTGLYGSVSTWRHDPPKQGARRLRG